MNRTGFHAFYFYEKTERSRIMRKHQQEQILKLLQTINLAQSKGLYADCQEGAVSIGNYIESIEGEGTETVALLEEYCELLFKAGKGEIKEKLLRKHLIKIENSVILELKSNRIEMVFLLYKASMSDSLESIYLAAKDDPDCDAYWIPIPYFELNADRTLGTVHYEGADCYGENIVCIDWQKYDIEARHPDVIFTHYAYDDNVNNATIHPFFYSKHLREHCYQLLYVPYFVAPGDTVDEYCGYLPGVLSAHHVIVQSEAVRQSYIEHYKKFDKEFGWKRRFGKAEEKFLALGSPKFDKIINTKREDCEIPPEWRRLIFNPDGSRKKIILYNTHMFAWINGGLAYFEKLRSVFDLFRSRDDVVLWWRPHPNTELNIRTKRPQWINEYKVLVDDYKHSGWGVYDDTPDLHRAIAWSDAYYGDGSSLVLMYQVTGKPIMLQKIEPLNDTARRNQLLFENLCEAEGFLWCTALDFNALFRLDPMSLQAEYMGSVPGEKSNGERLYRSLIYADGKLYFAPLKAERIAIYDIKRNTFQTMQVNEDCVKAQRPDYLRFKFYDVVSLDGNIYFIPYCYPAIVAYDTNTQELNYLDSWLDKSKPSQAFKNGRGYFCEAIYDSGNIIMPRFDKDSIVVFDEQNMSFNTFDVTQSDKGYRSICFDGNNYWMVSLDGKILRANKSLDTFSPVNLDKDFTSGKGNEFIAMVYLDGFLWAFPFNAKFTLRIDTNSMEAAIATDFPDVDAPDKWSSFEDIRYFFAKTIANKIYAHTGGYNPKFIEYDPQTGTRRVTEIYISEGDIPKIEALRRRTFNENVSEDMAPNDCNFREQFVWISDLVDNIVQEGDSSGYKAQVVGRARIRRNTIANLDGTAGQKIYEIAKKAVLGV